MKRWIWEQDNYPNFTYDTDKLQYILEKVSLEQGYLIAMSKVMDDESVIQRQSEALVCSPYQNSRHDTSNSIKRYSTTY